MTEAEKKQFLEQYSTIHASLMRFCMVKSQGIMDAKDLAGDVLLVGLENYHKLENKGALLSYLFTTASRICLNKLRQKKFGAPYHEKLGERVEDLSTTAETGVDIALLYKALDQLPALQREAVILFEISDLPIKEIMIIQNSGSSAVKQRIKRGREKLAELLGEKKQKKIAFIIPAFVASNSFSMSNLEGYFNTFKEIPLPLSSTEAGEIISNFQVSGTAAHVGASQLGRAVIKKGIIGGLIAGAIIVTALSLSNKTKNEQFLADVSHPTDYAPIKNSISKIQTNGSNQDYDASLIANNPNLHPFSAQSVLLSGSDTNLQDKSNELALHVANPLAVDIKADSVTHSIPLSGNVFSLAGISTILIDNLGDNVELRTWDKAEVQVIPNHRIEAKTPEDEALIRKYLTYKAEIRGDIIALQTAFCGNWKNSVSFGNKGFKSVSFNGNEKIKYKVIETNYIIMLPAAINLSINGYYKSVIVPDMQGELETNLFDSHFTCGSVQGKTNLKLHYSKANLGNLQDVTFQLMDSKVNFKNAKSVVLNAKYSTINASRMESCTIESFESTINIAHIDNGFEAGLKYSALNVVSSNIKKGGIKAFESHIVIPQMEELTLEMRYGSLKMELIDRLHIPLCFESKIYLNQAGEIDGESSKYTLYQIQHLAGSISLDSFQDKITIAKSALSSMTFSGKYTSYAITLAQPANYQFNFENKYGSLDYGSLNLTVVNSSLSNGQNSIAGYFQNGNQSASTLKFNCFESTIKLN